MTKEMKTRLNDLRRRYKQVDNEFLSLFEKRYIIFIENGVDLKKDCYCFGDEYKSGQNTKFESGISLKGNSRVGTASEGPV